MNIIIAGCGKVGVTLVGQLSSEGHNITLIDSKSKVLESNVERYDVIGVHGNGASMPVLLNAGVKDADLLIAMTNADELVTRYYHQRGSIIQSIKSDSTILRARTLLNDDEVYKQILAPVKSQEKSKKKK